MTVRTRAWEQSHYGSEHFSFPLLRVHARWEVTGGRFSKNPFHRMKSVLSTLCPTRGFVSEVSCIPLNTYDGRALLAKHATRGILYVRLPRRARRCVSPRVKAGAR